MICFHKLISHISCEHVGTEVAGKGPGLMSDETAASATQRLATLISSLPVIGLVDV